MRQTKKERSRGARATCLGALAGGACAAAWVGGLALAQVLLVLIAVGLLCHAHALGCATRRQFQLWREHERRIERQHAREYRLETAGARREVCLRLASAVHELDAADPDLVEQYRLFALLDMLGDLELARHRCLTVTGPTSRDELVRRVEELNGEPEHDVLRDLAERRLFYWNECADGARRCDDQIAIITELIEALRLRTAIPDLPASEASALARQLEIDDAAVAEVRALPSPVHAA